MRRPGWKWWLLVLGLALWHMSEDGGQRVLSQAEREFLNVMVNGGTAGERCSMALYVLETARRAKDVPRELYWDRIKLANCEW